MSEGFEQIGVSTPTAIRAPSDGFALPASLPVRPVSKAARRTEAPPALTLRELANGYMAAYTGGDLSRPATVSTWVELLGGETLLSEIDADLIAEALEQLASTPAMRFLGRDKATGERRWKNLGRRKPSTVNRYKSTLSAMIAWAQRRRLLARGFVNPARQIQCEHENNARIRFLSDDERRRLLAVARVSAWPRLYLLVLLALTTGARRGELLGLRVRDLDLAAGTARLRTSKNKQPRVLPLVSTVLAELERQKLPKDGEARLFPAKRRKDGPACIDSAWRKALADARLVDFRFHDLRHSCASYLAQSGASLLEIADVLGHKQLDVTKRYAHLTVDTKAALVHRVLGGIGTGA